MDKKAKLVRIIVSLLIGGAVAGAPWILETAPDGPQGYALKLIFDAAIFPGLIAAFAFCGEFACLRSGGLRPPGVLVSA